MDRNFSESEISEVIRISLQVHDNMLPYLCRENFDCRYAIARCFRAVKAHNLVPEQYWHGNRPEFEMLLTLLSDDYPGTHELLTLAQTNTESEIQNIAHHFYQRVVAMFEYVMLYHGYVVLRPTAYMTNLHPHSRGKLYVYTADKWIHNDTAGIDRVFLTLNETQSDDLAALIHKKVHGY